MLDLYLINFVLKTCRIRGSPVDSWQVRDDRIDCSVGLSKNPAIKILDNGHHRLAHYRDIAQFVKQY